jgi:hypothetical protein
LRRHLLQIFAHAHPLPPPSFALLARKCAILLKYQNALLAGLAVRSPLPQPVRNTFLEGVAFIYERGEWREYARGMYDETNFSDAISESGVLSGMASAMEKFREHERMSYNCVSIAMEYLSKKNFSGTAVEYCGRVLGMIIVSLSHFSGCILLLSWGCSEAGSCSQCCNTIHSTITR